MVWKKLGWCSDNTLREVASMYDVVVVHTTISTNDDAGILGAQLGGLTRLVWDCHDYIDNKAARLYDAVTCPSMGMAECFGDKGVVVYSKVPKALWPRRDESRPTVDAVVLQGTMFTNDTWSDYSGLEKRLGRPVFFYPSDDRVPLVGGCRMMRKLPYLQLLNEMQYYAAGYAGASREDVTIHDCVTNKFWEYIAAGIPVLTYNSKEMAELNKLAMDATMEAELDKMKEVYG